jgi:hypothetical protein
VDGSPTPPHCQERPLPFHYLSAEKTRVHVPDPEILEQIGLSRHERKALAALAILGVADAATLCREAAIPTSKIYRGVEKLARMGLLRVLPTRPTTVAALPAEQVVERVVALAREHADRVGAASGELRRTFEALPGQLRGRESFVDVALGRAAHVRRHLVHLATAQERVLSYLEQGDLQAIDEAAGSGFPLLRRVARNAKARRVRHRVVFGFSRRSAPVLLAFVKRHRPELRQLAGARYSGELGHPFHVVDDELVILPLDHPFAPEGRFASLLLRDRELVARLAAGFDGLWSRAMKELGEVTFDPRAAHDGTP